MFTKNLIDFNIVVQVKKINILLLHFCFCDLLRARKQLCTNQPQALLNGICSMSASILVSLFKGIWGMKTIFI